ncbi:MAG: TlpA family protein disulfide reductase [Bryobacterales bacterium]|nr:TlpA family protein disulfide reductase [Bryobacterales bacterium]
MIGVGARAPAFSLSGVSAAGLTAPVLLAFFKITCPTCQLTFPYLQRLADRGGPRVIGISQDDAAGTEEFRQAFGVRFETLLDPAADGYAVSNAYGLTHVPALVLVEADGSVSWKSEGFAKSELENLAVRWGVTLFEASDRVPAYKPG